VRRAYLAFCGHTVRFLGKLADGTVVDDETREFTIGDIELPKGVEKAIESLKVGEVATFVIRPDYAYGAAGNAQKNIPANATLHYEMELLHLNKQKDYWDFDKFSDKLDACLLRKNQGNDYFKAKKYNQALRKYKRGLEFVESTYNASEEEKKKVTEMKVLLNLNLAQCNLNLREWKTAIENCNKALEHDKANPKAFFRRGVARSALDEWSLASADFDKALELSPGDAAVISEYNKLKHKMKQQDLKDKRLYSNIFKKLSEQNDQPAAAASTATATTTTAAGASDDKMDVDSGSQ
jgi:tetratricopeptide (TPR) repeat protein